jgi:hypothetical protein
MLLPLRLTAPAALAAALAGCATLASPTTPSSPSAAVAAAPPASAAAAQGAASAPAAAARPDPTAPKPFAEVIKGATQQAGFLPVWRKDDKTWLEIPAERLDQPFLLSANVAESIGERGLYGSQMGPSWLASLRRVNNQIQLVALNTDYSAATPAMKTTVAQAFSGSLLAAGPVASAPHPERKSVLVDASFLLADLPNYAMRLEQAFRIPYALDRANSAIVKARVSDDLTALNLRMHFATPRLPLPPLVPPPPPTPVPTLPKTLPDARSLFVGYVVSFTKLPDEPMPAREADPRVGHFFDTVTDLTTDLQANPKRFLVNRWRLEKADPSAAISEPRQPIVFWLDKNIPTTYRQAVTEGVLEWNRAFERIGFRNAIVVKQQGDDDDFDTLDARHASIRWFVGADVGFARGPSHTDPRTGEIIDADIAMSDVFGRGARRFRVESVGTATQTFATPFALPYSNARGQGAAQACDYADQAAAEFDFAFELLEARGEIAPDSPEAEAFAQAVVRDTIMHEVGHTLGLTHNFRASTVYTRAQLQDKAFTEKNGISGSVMDYNAYNVAVAGEKQGSFNNTTLGPYDYWAIEYAYRPIPTSEEKAELARIAGRSASDPLLAFANDPDAGGSPTNDGIDPLVNRFDLGDDPLAYYRKRLQLSRELWDRVQARSPQPGDDPTRQLRSLLAGFRAMRDSPALVAKYVGGMYTTRAVPGASSRPAFVPVEPARQREALQFLATGLFAADSFRFKPEFLASLTPDYREWERTGLVSIPGAVLQLQTAALDRLLSAGTASRLLDLPLYVAEKDRRGLISLNEVYATLGSAVWSELKQGGSIDRLRRNLQREHLRRVHGLLVKVSVPLPADAQSLLRANAAALRDELRQALARKRWDVESRAHLQESLALLEQALGATMLRS